MIRPESDLGMDTTSSQFCLTNRDNPAPSTATTTNESVPSSARCRHRRPVRSPALHGGPALQRQAGGPGHGIQAAAPAPVRRHAVCDAERRCQIQHPMATERGHRPHDRTEFARVRKRFIPKRPAARAIWSGAAARSSGWYVYGGTWRRDALMSWRSSSQVGTAPLDDQSHESAARAASVGGKLVGLGTRGDVAAWQFCTHAQAFQHWVATLPSADHRPRA